MTTQERLFYESEARIALREYAPDGVTEREEFLFVAGWLLCIEFAQDKSRTHVIGTVKEKRDG